MKFTGILMSSAGNLRARDMAKDLDVLLIEVVYTAGQQGELVVNLTPEQRAACNTLVCIVHDMVEGNSTAEQEIAAMAEAARKADAASVALMVAYLPYTREYSDFTGPSERLQQLITFLNTTVDVLFCFDMHRKEIEDLFSITCYNLSAIDVMIRRLVVDYAIDTRKVVIVAPDKGARERAQAAAKTVACPIVYLTKERGDFGVRVHGSTSIPVNSIAIIVDDIIDSGKTLEAVVTFLQPHVHTIFAVITHAAGGSWVSTRLDRLPISHMQVADSLAMQEHPKVSYMPMHTLMSWTLQTYEGYMQRIYQALQEAEAHNG